MLTYPSNPIPTTLIKYCPLIIPISIFLFLPLIILSIASFIFNGIFALLAKSFPVPLGITPSGVFEPYRPLTASLIVPSPPKTTIRS